MFLLRQSIGLLFGALIIACCGDRVFGQEGFLSVFVQDQTNRPIPSASVSVGSIDGPRRRCESDRTRFVCTGVEDGMILEVSAEGFSPFSRPFEASELFRSEVTVTLFPAELNELVVVSALRTPSRLGETPVSVAVVGRREIEASAAPTLDDILRQVPGFSTFRRSSSRNSNPTAQGVSLRGVGSSGASRTLVMLGGVPLNDPFGGWVQWNRVSPVAVEQVELVRGGASALYGSGSLSGTVNVVPRGVYDGAAISAEAYGGTQGTFSGSVFAGAGKGGWSADGTLSAFRTEGFIPVEVSARGTADRPAGVNARSATLRLGKTLGGAGNIFARPSYFTEERNNGTELQTNRTLIRSLSIGGSLAGIENENGVDTVKFDWRIFGGNQVYDQTFSGLTPDRNTENLTRLQRSPSQFLGYSAQLTSLIRDHTIVGGVERREVRGSSDEVVFAAGNPVSLIGSGGREKSLGFYIQDVFPIGSRVVATAGGRVDSWTNLRGMVTTRTLSTGAVSVTEFPDRRETAFSPRLALLFRAGSGISLHAAASKSFRAPTLNELYRGFRVGNVVTNANEDLRAERANNFEGGVRFEKRGIVIRATAFRTTIDRAIANVTVSVQPNLITRQRQNAGRTRTAGFETDAEMRFGRTSLSAGYLFADARNTRFESNPALIGKRIPQVARHQATFQVNHGWKEWTFSAQARASGKQFDDDLNEFRLEPMFLMDISASRRVGERLMMFAAIENLFNSRYSVGRTPVRTLGAPFGIRAGVRWN
jgi:outer membrane receptor protein involved in Fe transport